MKEYVKEGGVKGRLREGVREVGEMKLGLKRVHTGMCKWLVRLRGSEKAYVGKTYLRLVTFPDGFLIDFWGSWQGRSQMEIMIS